MQIVQFSNRATCLHRANPVMKFVGFLMIILLMFMKISLFVLAALILFIFLLITVSHSWHLCWKRLILSFLGTFVFLLVINWVFKKNPGEWKSDGISSFTSVLGNGAAGSGFTTANSTKAKWFDITASQFVSAAYVSSKLSSVIVLSSVLTQTTSLSAIAFALEDIFRPLKMCKVSAKELSLIVAIAMRFTPALIQEAFRIIRAQSSRGIDFKNGKIKDKFHALLSLFVPLFSVAFVKADDLAAAMTARGYNPKNNRSSYRSYSIDEHQLVLFFFFAIFISFLYHFQVQGYYMSALGPAEMIIKFT